jgi:hypothetical protein
MKAFSNELRIFMMQIGDGRFAHHIMNMFSRLPTPSHDVDSRWQIRLLPE